MSGVLLKNGAELSGLSEAIRKNPIYHQIFGADRNF
jgi:hypothetical protein